MIMFVWSLCQCNMKLKYSTLEELQLKAEVIFCLSSIN